jgi:hypothetical protein
MLEPRAVSAAQVRWPDTAAVVRPGRRPRREIPWLWVILGIFGFIAVVSLAVQCTPVGMLISQVAPGPVRVDSLSLEPDPAGSAVEITLADARGQDVGMSGSLAVQVQEPSGAIWNTTQHVTSDTAQPAPPTSLYAGRLGYRIVVPASVWPRPPRQGGQTTVSVTATRDDGSTFAGTATVPFP